MKVLAIRGATTVTSNNKEEILKETSKLIETIILKNELNNEDIISMCSVSRITNIISLLAEK